MTSQAFDRYVSDSVATASPARLVTMLYDRLVRDLTIGEAAVRNGEREAASSQILHAQDIIMELRSTLDLEAWAGAPGLASLYDFLLAELIAANVGQDATKVASCRDLVVPLQQAWHAAADELAGQAAAASGISLSA
jgi:flagellar secretion chaperone FliS